MTAKQMMLAAPYPDDRSTSARWLKRLKAWLMGTPPPRRLPEPVEPVLETAASPSFRATADAVTQDDELPPKRMPGRFGAKNATARIIEAFDSAHPVRQRKDLHGRDDKLDTLFEAVLFSRQHAIIHGARGSGKTSLAQVFGDYADSQGAVVIYTACEATASFAELLRPYLSFIPESAVPFAEKALFAREREALSAEFGPRQVVDLVSRLSPDSQTILILDEFDRVESEAVNSQIATLMKLLSDARVPVQVLLVGIARTLDELILCHPSLRRHLTPIPIGRISREDTHRLIDRGAERAQVRFDEAARAEIASISCGSPYHVQLFCYVAAIETVRRGGEVIDLEATHRGLARAFTIWAMLNHEDADIFDALVADPAQPVDAVERIAREAAVHDSFVGDEADAAIFGAAVRADDRQATRFHFRDGAAPQFLLAKLATRERQTEAA
ncbi:ATP-binding protein [Sphingomonas carotinifaciens]|uniref:AAA ATPase domain-containing protein n=1 Tax=Sphingomonas carotinifaciens TaxID=1166323 RepID=A0A1G7QBD0_9SPHN|nr:ATP-binding protein [Sphingomonas carotinifaciens]MBB4087789.1 hypothetical protein [Sphingomonas carotinifaciens]MWC44848.1 AAA family ATPase [Sphingomonas carotinifaciens]SDF94900.1 AAA ATPase domain-containing protein [Sphingomonas carotinifaciens]